VNLTKGKAIMYTIIGLMSMILVYVMFIQFRLVKETATQEVEFMRETELRETLSSYKAKYQEVEEGLIEVEKKIEEYKQNEQSEEATEALLEKELQEAKMKLRTYRCIWRRNCNDNGKYSRKHNSDILIYCN